MAEINENELILSIQEGNQLAFRDLVNAHKKKALRLAWRYTGDMDEAEDIVQDAFIQAYRSIRNFRGDASFGTWFYRIVVNLSINLVKKKKRFIFTELDEDMVITNMNGDNNPSEMNMVPAVKNALSKLPERQRIIFSLRHFEELSTRQVSEILEISEGSVKKHLHRAVHYLRNHLVKKYPELGEVK